MLFLLIVRENGESVQILQVKYIPGVYIISSLRGGPILSEGVFCSSPFLPWQYLVFQIIAHLMQPLPQHSLVPRLLLTLLPLLTLVTPCPSLLPWPHPPQTLMRPPQIPPLNLHHPQWVLQLVSVKSLSYTTVLLQWPTTSKSHVVPRHAISTVFWLTGIVHRVVSH